MAKKDIDHEVYVDPNIARFNCERDFVKHLIWKDFESIKAEVTKVLNDKNIFSPAGLIAFIHYELEEIAEFVRAYK